MDASTLSKLYSLDGPFVTLYVDSSSTAEDAAEQYDIRWRNILRELEQSGVDAATREAISAARGEHGRGGTRVIVATGGSVQLAQSLPHPPAQEIVQTGNLPVLAPLVDALGLQVPHVVVLADRKGADVLAYTAGPDPVETGTVNNDRFPDRKVHAGGWAAKRYSNDVEETWEQSARDVAGLVAQVAKDVDARLVIASGDERALQLLPQHLPTDLVDRFVAIGGGGRHADGSDDVIADEVLRVLADTVTADTVELLEKFAEERGQDDRAADGVTATVAALRMGQVDTLVLTDARDGGSELFFGPDPTHLALSAQELMDLGVEQPFAAAADEVLIRAALGTGAEVRFVTGGVEQSPSEGVGALLRFSV
ncbi:MAG TPA: Vms1/Ankzf1 family peptidyl-tRNA hydrolase [Mycobacteriales bacterium]|nr:Vms1/Ankzf1 family peptidyl-tRNA hydrolase [Mycobacteriales bacterium]